MPVVPVPRPAQDAVLLDVPGMLAIDTRHLDWESTGIERAYRKVLTRTDDGTPFWFISYLPGQITTSYGLPHRHRHSRLEEYSFGLAGEYPIWEYEQPDAENGELVVLRPGYFLARKAGSIHGREPGPFTRVGWLSLTWRNRTGNWIYEDDFETESEVLDYPDDWRPNETHVEIVADDDGVVLDRPTARLVDTDRMPWSGEDGFAAKALLDRPAVRLVQLADSSAGRSLGAQNAFVVSGSVSVDGHPLPTHAFIRRSDGDDIVAAGRSGGTVLLTWQDP